MRVKKTWSDQRGTYRYPVEVPDGRGGYRTTYNEIKPGDDGTTEVIIQNSHLSRRPTRKSGKNRIPEKSIRWAGTIPSIMRSENVRTGM